MRPYLSFVSFENSEIPKKKKAFKFGSNNFKFACEEKSQRNWTASWKEKKSHQIPAKIVIALPVKVIDRRGKKTNANSSSFPVRNNMRSKCLKKPNGFRTVEPAYFEHCFSWKKHWIPINSKILFVPMLKMQKWLWCKRDFYDKSLVQLWYKFKRNGSKLISNCVGSTVFFFTSSQNRVPWRVGPRSNPASCLLVQRGRNIKGKVVLMAKEINLLIICCGKLSLPLSQQKISQLQIYILQIESHVKTVCAKCVYKIESFGPNIWDAVICLRHSHFSWNVSCTEDSEIAQPYQHLKLSNIQSKN